MTQEPFGLLRIRIVEYLARVYITFNKEIFNLFAENNIFDMLLFWFKQYPFHNILHQKVTEIFIHALDKNDENAINFLL